MSYFPKSTIKIAVALLIAVVSSKLPAASVSCHTNTVMAKLKQKINLVHDYRLQSNVFMDGKNISTSYISGKLPNYLKIRMQLHPNQQVFRSIFDGEHQWVETHTVSAGVTTLDVVKIRLDGLIAPHRPFDTTYYLMGSGLLNGEDFPSSLKILLSVYRLESECEEKTIRFSGVLDKAKFTQYASAKRSPASMDFVHKYAERFSVLTMELAPNTFLLKNYRMGSVQKPERFKVVFNDVQINTNVDLEEFSYTPAKGVKVNDISELLLEQLHN